ncbi:N-6 DNA methylase [Deinococcus fonticola]|uniref:N-6 DNA methylase n=1 Tax=Deinococcus fonticola TaxID=2528713 RepID=UPI0010752E26|nr:N-6 DNA methylase [Deinococcus fonticola]
MTALETPLRRTLEKKIIDARDTAEAAAQAVFDRLLVDNGKHGDAGNLKHLSDQEKLVRKGLLAKEKQLGSRDALIRECAYEQWHTMLFSRFLEANGLLVHPEHKESVTLDDLAELANEEGDADAYATAARYAAAMLPGIFRPHDPLLQVKFPTEYRQKLEALIEEIPKPTYTSDDGLGWVYQFWQTQRKKQVNESGRKIGGADISPVTQLFTEHYMVQFMLHNTIGAWWTARHPDQPLPTDKSYLRLNDDGTPAAGSFPGWPTTVKELKVIDPCCGSGHFLVAAFALLKRLRMIEEGLSEAEAGEAVLRDNLHGLELDPRCTQLAAFNLTLEAWKSGGYRPLPTPNVACSGLSISASVDDWMGLSDDGGIRSALKILHKQFQDATDLGSLINPRQSIRQELGMFADDILTTLPEQLEKALSKERSSDPAAAIFGENAQGVAKAAKLLGDTYDLVITNVPYLARGKQGDTLKTFIERRHPEAKADLATAFVQRCRDFAAPGGSYSLVTPQNWLFLGSYKRLRERLLKEQTWDWVARLGIKAFSTPMWDFNISFVTLTNKTPAKDHLMIGFDASAGKSVEEKDAALREGEVVMLGQEGQRGNPDSRISLEERSASKLLSDYAYAFKGLCTSDDDQFKQQFWERVDIDSGWAKYQGSISATSDFGGMDFILLHEDGNGRMRRLAKSQSQDKHRDLQGRGAWGKKGVAISAMRDLPATLFIGTPFDTNISVIIPDEEAHLPAIFAYCSSENYSGAVRKIDQALKVTNTSLVKVPFDLPYWQQVAAEKYPDGLPEQYSNDPTQWLFKGTVTDTTEPLQVAVARLLGYNWPEQVEDNLTPDADGIVPLQALSGEQPAHVRLQNLLAQAYGSEWNAAKLQKLLAQVGADSMEVWLRDKFFDQHSKLFHHRPFLWHIWDGRKDGFSAIVNYHALDRAKLEKLTYTYLGEWLDHQRSAISRNEKGAESRLADALTLQKKLEAILEGEPPYDIYVRWKELNEQPRGWNPDLNDGVRLNIRPFVEAGILRNKVNVKWGKDRGSDPGKKDFGEKGPQTDLEKHQSNERHNDLHFTMMQKKNADGQA